LVLEEGDTEVEPDVAPPVEKLVPVQLVAFEEDQVSVADWPLVIVVGATEMEQVGAGLFTVQLWYWYVPLNVPLEQLLVCETQLLPYGTVAAWYAVTLEP
jgi:hypothetical protein